MTEKMDENTQQVVATNPVIEKYLTTGAHIGTRFKSGDMLRYIYKQRKDGLKVLDVQVIDERVKQVGVFLSKYSPKSIVVVSRKVYGKTPAEEFAKTIGALSLTGRFVPGTFTNPQGKEFIQPKVVIITEPESDAQAIAEAARAKAVVVALASTNNSLANIDIAIPINNKGRKSLALVYWLLAKEFLKASGNIPSDEAFTRTIEEFEYPLKDGETEDQGQKRKRREFRGRRNRLEEAAGLSGGERN
jgi:small subunit ribosomal protein S2